MPPRDHALLSASSSHRWLNCCPSARLEEEFEDRETEAAAEGSAAHALAEHKLKRALKMRSEKPVSRYDCDEMDEYTDGYVQFVLEMLAGAKEHCTDPIVQIEQKLDFSCYVPDGFGTGDCVIIADDTLYIIDLKYGQGVLVDSDHNPQMMLYALGALRLYDNLYDIRKVSMSIYQPRRDNISTWSVDTGELRNWADTVLTPKAKLAFEGKGEYHTGPWCTFCKAAVKCRARAEEKLEIAKYEFRKPPLLTDTDIEEVLGKLDDLIHWANEISSYALSEALKGKQWSGWKIVEGRSNRKYKNEEEVIAAAKAAGYTDIFRQSLLTVTEMEKYMTKPVFKQVLGDLVVKPAGKPTLAPISDKRPAMMTSNNDFSSIQEEYDHE